MADKPVTRLASEIAAKEQKKKRGFFDKVGGFLADAGQEVGRIVTNPVETVQRLGSEAKSTFYDPIRNLPNAFDPTSGLSPMERVNTGLGGGLALADVATPFLPEGALANAMVKRAANRALAETGTTSFAKSGPINIMGYEVPYGPEAARYAAKLARLDETMGVAPGKGVASIGMKGNVAADVAREGVYDPILGRSGMIQGASEGGTGMDYKDIRNVIENFTNAPAYGYQRYPGDLSTASAFRGNSGWGLEKEGAIFNLRPEVPKMMSEGDSMYVFDAPNNMQTYDRNYMESIFSPYDPNITPPSPGRISEDLQQSADARGKLARTYYPSYRELQMGPLDIPRDVSSVMLPRGRPGTEMESVLLARRQLAEEMAKNNIPVVSGRSDTLENILKKDIEKLGRTAYPPGLLYSVGLIPDPVSLNRLPSRYLRPYRSKPYTEMVDF
jgi:hypothetical protein